MKRRRKVIAKLVPHDKVDVKRLAQALVEITIQREQRRKQREAAIEAERHTEKDAS
jgi:hypothetical protein